MARKKRDRTADQRDCLHWIFQLQRNSKNGVEVYSQELARRYGKQYQQHVIKPLIAAGELALLLGGSYDVKGHAKRYRAIPSPQSIAEALERLPDTYRSQRARTNLNELAPMPFHKAPTATDFREYSDYAFLPGRLKDMVTVDGEATVEFDARNLFPLVVGRTVKAPRGYLRHALNGTIYDVTRDYANGCSWEHLMTVEYAGYDHPESWADGDGWVTRNDAKKAIAKLMNSPRALRYVTSYVTSQRERRTYTSRRDKAQHKAATAFRELFPVVFARFRELAVRRQTFYLATKQESRLRNHILELASRNGIDCVLTAHDSFRVRLSDADTFEVLLLRLNFPVSRKISKS